MEYHAIKWIDENRATRFTKEVNLNCHIICPSEKFNKWQIILTGEADLEHHLVEDSAILLKKMCEKKCGYEH